MPNYRRGFRAEAERLALDVRTGLGLGAYAALDPLALARDLEVPVLALSALTVPPPGKDLIAGLGQAVGLLLGTEAAAFSAMTVFLGSRRVIVHNDAHNPGRQASDIGHELAHGLLLHSPTPALDDRAAATGTRLPRQRPTTWRERCSSPPRLRGGSRSRENLTTRPRGSTAAAPRWSAGA